MYIVTQRSNKSRLKCANISYVAHFSLSIVYTSSQVHYGGITWWEVYLVLSKGLVVAWAFLMPHRVCWHTCSPRPLHPKCAKVAYVALGPMQQLILTAQETEPGFSPLWLLSYRPIHKTQCMYKRLPSHVHWQWLQTVRGRGWAARETSRQGRTASEQVNTSETQPPPPRETPE